MQINHQEVELQDIKIGLNLPEEVGFHAEWVWAKPVSEDLYQINNIPFFAPKVYYGDIVEAKVGAEGRLMVTKKIAESGHKTILVLFHQDCLNEKRAELLLELRQMDLYIEQGVNNLFALDIPPLANLDKIRAVLQVHEAQENLIFDEE